MHRARAFFYVCAGLFLLALSYHLGARSATAQVGGEVDCASAQNSGYSTAVIGRYIYTMPNSVPGGQPTLVSPLPIPGASPVIACDANTAVLQNGEVWRWTTLSGGEWSLAGTFGGSPTPTARESFGALKSRYRGERGVAQPARDR